MKKVIRELLARLTGIRPRALTLQIQPLHGGLVSPSVCAVTVHYTDGRGAAHRQRWVVKLLAGRARREVAIYQALRRCGAGDLAPSVVGVARCGASACRLILEQVVPSRPWPWQDAPTAARVLRALARLHGCAGRALAASVSDWDYEGELQLRAEQLLSLLEQQRTALQRLGLDVRLSVVRRLTRELPEWRRALLGYAPLGSAVIHGDAHPGNIVLARRATRESPVLFDWERARLGSPLEDVSSWLQTLAFWEPEARRRHDTLLSEYLLARGRSPTPSRTLRDLYWLAAASNCLAGSLLYHLEHATCPQLTAEVRQRALGAVRDQLRILRRADACWSGSAAGLSERVRAA